MKILLLSGGSGKRLWPLSSDARSKQFLKVLKNQAGQYESMLQRLWTQLVRAGHGSNVYIVASASHTEIIKQQLGDEVSVIVEPERRDTFPAIALSCLYLRDQLAVPDDEVICVLPVDPFVEDAYFHKMNDFENLLNEVSADLALMGTPPTYPSAKYGYIMPTLLNTSDRWIQVKAFHEKPSEQEAESLMKDQALWNCGVFAFKLSYMGQIMRQHHLPSDYKQFERAYSTVDKVSFDIAVVEKASQVVALIYEGYWKDLGTWNTLTEEIGEKVIGHGMLSEDSYNTHIVNELNVPVFVLNVSNAVVAVSHEGILVTDKPTSPRLKDLMKDFNQITMYEERQWGSYRVLDYFDRDGRRTITKRLKVFANALWQSDTQENEIHTITVISGDCMFSSRACQTNYKKGDIISIPPNHSYSLFASFQELELILVQLIGDNESRSFGSDMDFGSSKGNLI